MLIAQLGFKKTHSIQFVLVLWSKDKILNYRDYFKCMTIVTTNLGSVSTANVTGKDGGGW